jgi:hypothetical protein
VKSIGLIGRAVGIVCGALLASAWSYAMWVPSAGINLSGISFVVALLLTMFAVFAAIAAFKGHAAVVVLMFLASFFPVGVTLITAQDWLRTIGYLDLGLLLAALLIWISARHARDVSPENASS